MSNSDDDDNFRMIITQISSHQDNESIISDMSPFSPTLDATTSSQKSAADNFDPLCKKRKI